MKRVFLALILTLSLFIGGCGVIGWIMHGDSDIGASLFTRCYAAEDTFEVKTGFGYFKDNTNHIVSKAQLPKGEHLITGGFTYVEVSSQEALDKVKISEPEKFIDELKEEAIAKEQAEILRKQAIDNLKAKGILNANEEYVKEK